MMYAGAVGLVAHRSRISVHPDLDADRCEGV